MDIKGRIKINEVKEDELMEKIQRIVMKTGVTEKDLSDDSKAIVREAKKRMNPIYEQRRMLKKY